MKQWRFHGVERDAWKAYSKGKSGLSYDVVLPGLKYNLTDLQASLGIHQLQAVPTPYSNAGRRSPNITGES